MLRVLAAISLVTAAWFIARGMGHGDPITIPAWRIAAAAVLMAANCWLGPLRLYLTGLAVGVTIPARTAAMAISSGFFAGALGLSIVGQAGGSIATLAVAGISPYRATIIFAAERGLALCVLGTAASLAAIALYGDELPPTIIAAVVAIGGIGAVAIAPALGQLATRFGLEPRWLMASLTVATLMQACCLAAWIVLLGGLATPSLVPGAILVMLASAIPLGLAGFGPREVGAVTILAPLGIAAIDAFTSALMIGIVSLAAVTLLGLWAVAGWQRIQP